MIVTAGLTNNIHMYIPFLLVSHFAAFLADYWFSFFAFFFLSLLPQEMSLGSVNE